MLLFYVRHGDPIYNPDSLTPLGNEQAEAVKKRLGQFGLNKIYSSDSNRAYLTAKPTADMLKLEIEQLPWCNESIAYSELSVVYEPGKATWCFNHAPIKRFFASEEVRLLGKKWYNHPYFEGTKYKDGIVRIQKETDAFMLNLGYRHDNENNIYIPENVKYDRVALFAHEGFGVAFLSCLLDIPYPEFSLHATMSHSGMTVIEFNDDGGFVIPKVLQLSNDSHLYAERLPLKYQNRIYF